MPATAVLDLLRRQAALTLGGTTCGLGLHMEQSAASLDEPAERVIENESIDKVKGLEAHLAPLEKKIEMMKDAKEQEWTDQ